MARLTEEQWRDARIRWERSPKTGFEWLAKKFNVSRVAITKRAKSENWTKKVTQKVTRAVKSESTLILNETSHNNYKYEPQFAEQAYDIVLAVGKNKNKLAAFFGVCVKTIDHWLATQPEFKNAIEQAIIIESTNVVKAMLDSALGKHVIVDKIIQADGSEIKREKQLAPSVKAQEVLLTNWSPQQFQRNPDVKEELTAPFPDITLLEEISNKALAVAQEREAIIEGRAERLGLTNKP
jgi:hypothetical protein